MMRQNSRSYNSIRNSINGTVQLLVMTVGPFIIRTVIIWKLGREYIGLNGLFSSLVQIVNLSELGMNNVIVFFLYKPIENGEIEKVNQYLAWVKKFYCSAGCFVAVLELMLFPFLDMLIEGDCPPTVNIYLLYLIYMIGNVINYFAFPYKCTLLTANQRMDYENRAWIFSSLLVYSLQLISIMVLESFYLYVIVGIFQQVMVGFYRKKITDKIYPQYICRGNLSKKEVAEIRKNIIDLIGHRINSTVINSSDNIFLSSFCGLAAVALYGNYLYICSSIGAVINIIFTSIVASIGNYIIKESVKSNLHMFYTIQWINEVLVGWSAAILISLYQGFINLWLGKTYLLSAKTMILFVAYFYVTNIRLSVTTYKDACGMWKQDKWKPYFSMITNIVLDYALVVEYGINGVLIASIVSIALIEIPWETYVLNASYFRIAGYKIWGRRLLYTSVNFGIIVGTYVLCGLIQSNSFKAIMCRLFIAIFVPGVLYGVLYYRTVEMKTIKEKVGCFFSAQINK